MADKGLSPSGLAALAGVDVKTITAAMAATRTMTFANRTKVEDALELAHGTLDNVRDSADSPVGETPSDLPPNVSVIAERVGERAGRNIITVRAEALGVTVTVDYDGPGDRKRALAEAMWALGIERGHDSAGDLHTEGDGD
jgi:hypothetical protein